MPAIRVDLLLRARDRGWVCTVSTVTEINRESRDVVARNIKRQRVAAGYSKRQLAKDAGVHEYQLRHWEAGKYEPSARNLIKLAAVIGQSLEWFYEDHDDGARDG
jgi:DNA-binding XRE family transcriptional regulator